MVQTAVLFCKYLDSKGKKYDYEERQGKSDVVEIRFSGDNWSSIPIRFFFDTSCEAVAVRCFSICMFNQNKLAAGLLKANELNNEYRWLRFYIDEDNEATAAIDAVIDTSTVGEVCYELMIRMLNIVDDVYPEFMKACWS